MAGTHEDSSCRPRAWVLVALVAVLVATGALLTGSPAGSAGATVNAQLSLSGVATKTSVLGGTTVGIHPGDTVKFKASAVPTAGLENVPGLGSLLSDLTGVLTKSAFQVRVTFANNVPSVAGRTVTLGGPSSGRCKGASERAVRFPSRGTYKFTWTVTNVVAGLLGCSAHKLGRTDLNQLEKAGVKLNAENQYVGQVVSADNPPRGGISIQLPRVGASPKIGPIQLPKVSIPGASLPTVGVPDLPAGQPGSGKPGSGKPGSSKTSPTTPKYDYTPPGLTVPDRVVPKGSGGGADLPGGSNGGSNGGYYAGLLPDSNSGIGASGNQPALAGRTAEGGATANNGVAGSDGTVDLAGDATKPSGQLPVVLAIIAVLALALVAGAYARLFLLRKQS